MSNVLLPIMSLFISSFLIIVFFSKEYFHNKETKVYSKMLIVNLIFNLLCIIGYIVAKVFNNNYVVGIIQKIYMISLLLLIALIIIYMFNLLKIDKKNCNIIEKTIYVSVLILSLLVLVLPINVINYDDVLDGDGLSYDIALIGIIIYFMIITCLSIYIFIKNKEEFSKNIPFIVLIVLYILGLVVRIYIPYLMFENFFFAFTLLIMYHTIENPDVKMLKQTELAKEEADKASMAKSDFLSSMSHEIRTPLNSIIGFTEDLLNYKDKLPPEAGEDMDYILDSSKTLNEIVGNILDINKIESNKMEIINESYNFKNEINGLAKINATRIGDKPIDFKVNISSDIPDTLIGDRVHIKEIVNNLLTNSIKYTEKGEIELAVRSAIKDNTCTLLIIVKDTGKGIKKEDMDKLYNKFERLDAEINSTVFGAGLGLAITKNLVEMMGGKIDVESTYGQGSMFMVTIPQKIVVEEKTSITIEPASYHKEEITTTTNNNKKILIVDDNLLYIKVAKRALSDMNFELEDVTSGEECINKIKSGNKYDVILMDIMMPKMSGETTLQELKKLPSFDIPVMAVTADANAGAEEQYLNEGFVDYVAKPYTKDQIKAKLEKIL